MSYSRNIPDWQQYNALQSGGSDAAKSGQNGNSSHLYVSNISPPSMNGLNLSTDCLSKSQNDVINYSQRNYQPPNSTPSGSSNLAETSLNSMVHVSNCIGHYGGSSSMNSMMDDASNVDVRNGSVATLNEEMAHRNQISLNGPVPRVMGPNMNVNNNMGTTGQRIPPVNTVPSNRQGSYMATCKGPCCTSDPNVNYQTWEKFPPYQASNAYRENIRASGYAADNRRYRNEVAYRKDSYPSKDMIPPNSFHIDQRRNFTDYKYPKDPSVPRNYQPSTVLPNYPLPNYSVPGDYQKYAYAMKDYQRQGVINTQNSGLIKYPEHNANVQEKYSPKQNQYQSGALLQKGLVVPSISTNMSPVQNPYLNPQFSREFQWENHEKDTSKVQNQVSMQNTYPKYQLYQQKYAMQRFSMENHLRELSRIPGYQTHPKYQECIHRYRELLRLQQTVDYQSAMQNTLTSANSTVPPINLQFDQNGVLINRNYLPANFSASHNTINPVQNSVNLEKEQHVSLEKNPDLQHLSVRNIQEEFVAPNPENIPREVQYMNQKTIESQHCQVVRREDERFEILDPREEEHKSTKSFASKPALDVRQFLANWDEAEEEEGNTLSDVVLSNPTPIVVVEYENLGLVAHSSENPTEQKLENEPSLKPQEYYPKDQSNVNLLQDCSNDLNQGVVYDDKLRIKCVREEIDSVPRIHIVENSEGETECRSFTYNEKPEPEVPVNSLNSLTETNNMSVTVESKEPSTSVNYKKIIQSDSDSKLQISPQDLSTLPLEKSNSEPEDSNLKKQNSFTNEENHNPDDISLPDLTTSECTPISTTLNTPTHSDSEETTEQGVDLTTSTNPIEIIQNSPMISFTQSPVKMDPYEHLKGEHLSEKSSQDGLDFDFQGNNDSVIKFQDTDNKKDTNENVDSKFKNSKAVENEIWPSCSVESGESKYEKNPISEKQSGLKCTEVNSASRIISENSVNKDSQEYSSNMDVFSTEDQDKWCWNSIPLMPGDENEEPKIPALPMDENYLTKIMKESTPITSLNVHEPDEEKVNKVDDICLDDNSMKKGMDSNSDTKTSSNEKDQKIQKKKDVAEASASVSKILKNIRDRQNSIKNVIQDSKNTKQNSKGISIISEEIFNSTWRRNTQNKMYPENRKLSDSFEREEILAFSENLKNSHQSRSKSLKMNLMQKRSKSAENVKTENKEENLLLMELKNLKRKRSIDHFQEENKSSKFTSEKEEEPVDKICAKHVLPIATTETFFDHPRPKNNYDQDTLRTNENRKQMDSDLEIKFRNCNDSNKSFEAFKIEINVSRGDSKAVMQSLPQSCDQLGHNGNHEPPTTCGSTICSGRNSINQPLPQTDSIILKNQTSLEDLDKIAGNRVKDQEEERIGSVIEYFGKGQNPQMPSLNYAECLKNPLEGNIIASNSTFDCLSNRLKSVSKSKPIEDSDRKSKLQELKKYRKIKYKDNICFTGYENNHRTDKLDTNESLETLPDTSEFSRQKSLHTSEILREALTMSPKGYLNPIFSTLEEAENLNSVPVYTTKDGKITYSPNPRFTYRALLMEAQQKESRSHYENYSSNYSSSSTSQEKRSSKLSDKRSYVNKYQTDVKPPKKSLAKRFATQELEKSYQRYLSYKESKLSSLTNEPMVIKTIKNYNAFNESSSEAFDEKQKNDSKNDFYEINSQIENIECDKNYLEEKIDENAEASPSEALKIVESNIEHIIEEKESQVVTEIRSPSPGNAEDNQVVPVSFGDKNLITATDNKDVFTVVENKESHLESSNNYSEIMETDKVPNFDAESNTFNLDSKSDSNVENKDHIQDFSKEDSRYLKPMQDVPTLESSGVPERRQSTPGIESQSQSLISERRRSESDVLHSAEINSEFVKYLEECKTKTFLPLNEEQSSKNTITSEITENTELVENMESLEIADTLETTKQTEIEIDRVSVNPEPKSTSEESSNVNKNETETLNLDTIMADIENEQENIQSRPIEEEEKERHVVLPSVMKDNDIETIDLEDDSNSAAFEINQDISQNAGSCDKVYEEEENDSLKKTESNLEEPKLTANIQVEEELVTSRLDLESKSETPDIITKEVDKAKDMEVPTINLEETLPSNIESISFFQNRQEVILKPTEETQEQSVKANVHVAEIPTNEDESCQTIGEQEVEIVSEICKNEEKNQEKSECLETEDNVGEPLSGYYNKESNQASVQENIYEHNQESEYNRDFNETNNEENNEERIWENSEVSDFKKCEREYLESRGLSPSPEIETSPEVSQDKSDESTKEIIGKNSNEKDCLPNENKFETDQSEIQIEDSSQINKEDSDKDSVESIYIEDDSCFEVDPPKLEVQKELIDSEICNSSKSSDSNQFHEMPDVTLEENVIRKSHLKSCETDKTVPKLVIRTVETNKNALSKSKPEPEISVEPLFHRKIPKMIIRNVKYRPVTPSVEEIPEESSLPNEDTNVNKSRSKLDDINKSGPHTIGNEESRIPKMKIKLEDKLPKIVIENIDLCNSQDLQKLVPKMKIKKFKNLHSKSADSKSCDLEANRSRLNNLKTSDLHSEALDESYLDSESMEMVSDSSLIDAEECRSKIPKVKIKKDLISFSSISRKRRNSDVLQTENKKTKKASKEETKQDRRTDPNLENSIPPSDCQSMAEKIPKVIIKRTSPTAEFKCEVSSDNKTISLKDSSLQPQVVLQRSWILDCMAKELRHVNIALKLAIAKNGEKASVRGRSNSSKIQWEQFIHSLKKQKELSRIESSSDIFSSKVKQRRKSDCGMRYFDTGSRFYKIKACQSAREVTNGEENYLDNQSLYYKDMFTEKIQSNQRDAYERWKKFDENMNSESKDLFQDAEKLNFSSRIGDQTGNTDGNHTELKPDEEMDTKYTFLNAEEVVGSKTTLAPDVITIFDSLDENEANMIRMKEESQEIFDVRPELPTSLVTDGGHEYLYSEDAIPTQFEFELEIVDSSVDTYDVPTYDNKEFPESNDDVEFGKYEIPHEKADIESTNDSDQLPRLLLPDEESSCLISTGQDSLNDIKDEVPVLNDLLHSTDTTQNLSNLLASSSTNFSDSHSLVQEVMAAKEMLRKYLPKCEKESTSRKSRPKVIAEKKQRSVYPLVDSEKGIISHNTGRETSNYFTSRSHTRYDKKRSKESSRSREKYRSRKTPRIDEETCKYEQDNAISLRDRKRSNLRSIQSDESNKIRDSSSRSKAFDLTSKRSGSRSNSKSRKSRESSKDRDRNKNNFYKTSKLSKSDENSSENSTESKVKEEMPILEPQGGMNLDPSSDRDTSLSPPVITNQEDIDVFEEGPKMLDDKTEKVENIVSDKVTKAEQMDPGVSLADAVQKWVFHEKVCII